MPGRPKCTFKLSQTFKLLIGEPKIIQLLTWYHIWILGPQTIHFLLQKALCNKAPNTFDFTTCWPAVRLSRWLLNWYPYIQRQRKKRRAWSASLSSPIPPFICLNFLGIISKFFVISIHFQAFPDIFSHFMQISVKFSQVKKFQNMFSHFQSFPYVSRHFQTFPAIQRHSRSFLALSSHILQHPVLSIIKKKPFPALASYCMPF